MSLFSCQAGMLKDVYSTAVQPASIHRYYLFASLSIAVVMFSWVLWHHGGGLTISPTFELHDMHLNVMCALRPKCQKVYCLFRIVMFICVIYSEYMMHTSPFYAEGSFVERHCIAHQWPKHELQPHIKLISWEYSCCSLQLTRSSTLASLRSKSCLRAGSTSRSIV